MFTVSHCQLSALFHVSFTSTNVNLFKLRPFHPSTCSPFYLFILSLITQSTFPPFPPFHLLTLSHLYRRFRKATFTPPSRQSRSDVLRMHYHHHHYYYWNFIHYIWHNARVTTSTTTLRLPPATCCMPRQTQHAMCLFVADCCIIESRILLCVRREERGGHGPRSPCNKEARVGRSSAYCMSTLCRLCVE